MDSITLLDIFIIIPALWFAFKGFNKGFIHELASLAALVLGIYAAFNFSDFTAGVLTDKLNLQTEYLHIIAFAITFIVVVILTNLVGKLVETVINIAMLGFVNKLAGLAFGVLKIALIISALFYILHTIDIRDKLISDQTKKKSLLYEPVSSLVYIIIPVVQDFEWKQPDKEKEPSGPKSKTV
ncbi:MAG: CvpA family protein [Bacteroidales bacterium]|nr:CvpA family protein [Bacteroidales bacterium]